MKIIKIGDSEIPRVALVHSQDIATPEGNKTTTSCLTVLSSETEYTAFKDYNHSPDSLRPSSSAQQQATKPENQIPLQRRSQSHGHLGGTDLEDSSTEVTDILDYNGGDDEISSAAYSDSQYQHCLFTCTRGQFILFSLVSAALVCLVFTACRVMEMGDTCIPHLVYL